MKLRDLAVAITTVVVMAAAACSGGDSESGADDTVDHFESVMSYAYEEAERLNASPEQIALLEEAERLGEVPFELYSEAVDNALRCLREAGVEPYDGGVYEERGFPMRSYTVPVEAEAADPVEFAPGATVHRCVAEHSHTVSGLYQNQPSSVEAEDARWKEVYEPHRDEIIACAADEGIDIDPEANIRDIVGRVLAAVDEGLAEVNCVEGIEW